MANKLNLGYIGWLLHDDDEHCRTQAVCDIQQVKLDRYLAKHPEVKGYTDFREMAADPELEAVMVAVPNHLHYEVAKTFLEAGKHVFLEKPMGVNQQQLDELLQIAQRSAGQFVIDFECRVSKGYERVTEIVASGEIGEPRFLELLHHQGQWLGGVGQDWRVSQEKSGGLFFEELCHYIDLFRLWGGSVREAQAIAPPPNLPQYEFPENTVTHLFFDSGAVGSLITVHGMSVHDTSPAHYNSHGHDMLIVLIGTKGALRIDIINRKILVTNYVESSPPASSMEAAFKRIEYVNDANPFHDIDRHRSKFIQSCLDGTPLRDIEDVWRTFRVCLAAEASIQNQGTRVTVDYSAP